MPTRFVEEYDGKGNLVRTIPYQVPQEWVNAESLKSKAVAAIAANNTYISLPSPNASQTTAHVKTLSRECNAIIRLLLSQLEADDA